MKRSESSHDLLHLLVAQHAALLDELVHVIREFRDCASHLSTLIDAHQGRAATQLSERSFRQFKM
jgi:hypothetical protein